MYYRKKILLALMQQSGGTLEKFRLHKLLFLFCNSQEKASYDFVPYKFGAYSFSANADLTFLKRDGLVAEDETQWILSGTINWISELTTPDQLKLRSTMVRFGSLSANELIQFTYKEFPRTAINSKIRSKILGKEIVKSLDEPSCLDPIFFTIGYEGRSLETYLNLLIDNKVKLLCDVRRNAYSMKYGFSKQQLKNACEGVGIEYEHLPSFGIASEERKELGNSKSHLELFDDYDRTLENKAVELETFVSHMRIMKRVAITCFEASECNCHRGRLSKKLLTVSGWEWETVHL